MPATTTDQRRGIPGWLLAATVVLVVIGVGAAVLILGADGGDGGATLQSTADPAADGDTDDRRPDPEADRLIDDESAMAVVTGDKASETATENATAAATATADDGNPVADTTDSVGVEATAPDGATQPPVAPPDSEPASGTVPNAAAPAAPAPVPGGSTGAYESIRNRQDRFSAFAEVPSAQLPLGALTEAAPRPDNGPSPEGQFRVACEYSHFGNDDPVIFPGQPGASHLHMFFGNTLTNAYTTEDELLNRGGGTCSGFELNRSGYWTPALLDGNGNAVVPHAIILYYKTKFPDAINPMPQGLQMLAGNLDQESFQASDRLHWSCGGSGFAYNKTNRIPDCGGDYINATIQFPSCWDGTNLGADDFVSHLDFGSDSEPCPASHPVRLPRISVLLYFQGVDSVDGWHLSSDNLDSFNNPPGGTLHADWWGAWNDDAMDLWIDGCMRASRNCSFGQTGTDVQLVGVSDRDVYEGEKFLPLP